MRLLSNNEFIINNINDDNNIIINNINDDNNIIIININIIILLYKIFIKCVNKIIKRKRRNCDIYNNLEFIL